MADDFDFSFDDLENLLSEIDDGGGKPLDVMHEETDREIEKVRKRLAKEYKQAEKELKQKANDHFKKFEKADKEKARLVKDGKLSNEDYITWRKNKILYDKTLQAKVKSMSDYLASVDRHAADIVNGRLTGIYANNYNYELYKIEKGMGATTSLVLHNEKSVERLARKNPKLLPNPSKKTQEKIKSGKIKKWSQRKINNAITQGILQGEPIMDIADRLTKVVSMEWNSAVRNARTSMTGAQNAGRLGTYKDAGRLGIKTKKQWMATLDERTRESHQELDGESVPVDEPFSNGLMFPADPDGEPEEVYNCRCTMVADIEDYPDEGFERYVNGESVGDMTYKDWLDMKNPDAVKETVLHTQNVKEFVQLKQFAERKGISYNKASTMEPMAHENVVAKIAGGDKTTGSCMSQAFTYVANTKGIDVLDFRGGKSTDMFSDYMNLQRMIKLSDAKVRKEFVEREAKDTAKLLAGIEKDKEFILIVGRHAAVVRNSTEHGLQYLELQSETQMGYMPFETSRRTAEETLQKRFGCRKRIDKLGTMVLKKEVMLVDIDSMKMTEEYKEMLGYINTAKSKQKKGIGGGEK